MPIRRKNRKLKPHWCEGYRKLQRDLALHQGVVSQILSRNKNPSNFYLLKALQIVAFVKEVLQFHRNTCPRCKDHFGTFLPRARFPIDPTKSVGTGPLDVGKLRASGF